MNKYKLLEKESSKLIVARIYFPAYPYKYYKKTFVRFFSLSIIICILLGSKVYQTQKTYIRVLECINKKISIDEFESVSNSSGEQFLYITRTDCKECIDVTNELYHVLLSTGINLQHYDTTSDRVEHFEGSSIISGIINHANHMAEIH